MTQETDTEFQVRLADAELTHAVAQFYFYEAELLDDGRFADWLEIFDEDLFYFAPLRTNRLRRQAALSIGQPGEAAYFDETKDSLAWRGGNELPGRGASLVYRTRLQTEPDIYAGGRTDVIRMQPDGGFKVATREILFDANVLQAKNLSTFF